MKWNFDHLTETDKKTILALGCVLIAIFFSVWINILKDIQENEKEYLSCTKRNYYYIGRADKHVYILSAKVPISWLRSGYIAIGSSDVVKAIDYIVPRCGVGKEFFVKAEEVK